ncbi:hypothetical protein OK074_1574 [Actinobacteria bacterium OK074]|nr:hypothetical protein OK074_1574 [Actinobacteria bacterium OK074]
MDRFAGCPVFIPAARWTIAGMSQQGEKPIGHEDDWWGELYDDFTGDTGPTPTADSLDDRFASAADAVGGVASAGADVDEAEDADAGPPRPVPLVPEQRGGAGPDAVEGPAAVAQRRPAPWDPPADRPQGPTSFPADPPSRVAPPEAGPADEAPPPGTGPAYEVPPPGTGPAYEAPRPGTGPAYEAPRPGTEPAYEVPPPAEAAPAAPLAPPAPPRGAWPPADPRSLPPTADAAPAPPSITDITPTTSTTPITPARPPSYVGSGPPTYDAEPTALPLADPDELDDLVPDTVLDGARYGVCTVRAVSLRGDSARFRGEPRRDSLLTARFGVGEHALVLVAMATGARATPGAHRAAAEACHWIGRAVGRSHARLAEDIRADRRGDLKAGLHRLTARSLGKLRAGAAEQGIEPEEYTATLRCLLLPADPHCRTRVFFGVGDGGLFRLRDGAWQDIEPHLADQPGGPGGLGSPGGPGGLEGLGAVPSETPEGDRFTMDLGIATPPSPYEPAAPEPPHAPFRFRASEARPGDTLLLCTAGLADPLRGEPELAAHLTARWTATGPPGLADFLADTQVRVKGYADDRTAAGVWEAEA